MSATDVFYKQLYCTLIFSWHVLFRVTWRRPTTEESRITVPVIPSIGRVKVSSSNSKSSQSFKYITPPLIPSSIALRFDPCLQGIVLCCAICGCFHFSFSDEIGRVPPIWVLWIGEYVTSFTTIETLWEPVKWISHWRPRYFSWRLGQSWCFLFHIFWQSFSFCQVFCYTWFMILVLKYGIFNDFILQFCVKIVTMYFASFYDALESISTPLTHLESFIVRTMIETLEKTLIIHFTAWLPATSKVLKSMSYMMRHDSQLDLHFPITKSLVSLKQAIKHVNNETPLRGAMLWLLSALVV